MRASEKYCAMMFSCGSLGKVDLDPDPPFPYKYDLPLMRNYNRPLPDEYWGLWPVNEYSAEVSSWISWNELDKWAQRVSYPDKGKLRKVERILVHGALLGCEGTGRLPSSVQNSPSVAANGSKVADTLMDWVKMGIVYGPFRQSEIPFEEYKVSPMSVAPKPGGKIRLIVGKISLLLVSLSYDLLQICLLPMGSQRTARLPTA